MILAFILWCLCACLFLVIGILCFLSKRPVGFWANCRSFPVKDVRGYNRAMGILWVCYSLVLVAAGIPFLFGKQNDPVMLLPVLGVVADTIALMLIYILVIEKKYRKK